MNIEIVMASMVGSNFTVSSVTADKQALQM